MHPYATTNVLCWSTLFQLLHTTQPLSGSRSETPPLAPSTPWMKHIWPFLARFGAPEGVVMGQCLKHLRGVWAVTARRRAAVPRPRPRCQPPPSRALPLVGDAHHGSVALPILTPRFGLAQDSSPTAPLAWDTMACRWAALVVTFCNNAHYHMLLGFGVSTFPQDLRAWSRCARCRQ